MVKKVKKVKDELLDHDFDGIQELDNELPPWWLPMFYVTLVWSVAYLIYYHVLGIGPSSLEEYQAEMARAAQMYRQPAPQTPAATVLEPRMDEASLREGKAIYDKNCIPCHGKLGEGLIGPNLTDDYWIHGGRFEDVVRTITNGVPAKGMIAWKTVLKPEDIVKVASYVESLRGTNPPNAKAPEGEKYIPEAVE